MRHNDMTVSLIAAASSPSPHPGAVGVARLGVTSLIGAHCSVSVGSFRARNSPKLVFLNAKESPG